MHCVSFLLLCLLVAEVSCYYPLICIAGFGDTPYGFMKRRCDEVKKKHPGTEVTVLTIGTLFDGAVPIEQQIEKHKKKIIPIFKKNPDGVNMVGYSLGGLIAKGIIETTTGHPVRTYVSVNSPFVGVDKFSPCKDIGCVETSLFWFGFVPQVRILFKLLYGSNRTSDDDLTRNARKRPEYVTDFLPKMNNLIRHKDYDEYKRNILALNKLILIGSKSDRVIDPWQSAIGGFYDRNYKIVPLEQQEMYLNDTLGFKTMAEDGRLQQIKLDGWHSNVMLNSNLFHKTITNNLD